MCVLGTDLLEIHTLNLATRYRTAHSPGKNPGSFPRDVLPFSQFLLEGEVLASFHGTFKKQYLKAFPEILGRSADFAQTPSHLKLASRASHPGLTVGLLRFLRNGLRTTQKYYDEGEEETCRVGSLDEPDSLMH